MSQWLTVWNRKLHNYFGLYMLLFLWLFGVSGLLLNNPKWIPHKPVRTTTEHTVQVPSQTDYQARAENLATQLGLEGEIAVRRQAKKGHFTFLMMRGGTVKGVSVNLQSGATEISTRKMEPDAIVGLLHTFTGIRGMLQEANSVRDWFMTKIWSFSIDAISIGLLFLAASSLYMWYDIKPKRIGGLIAFGLGLFCCVLFIWGLAWIT